MKYSLSYKGGYPTQDNGTPTSVYGSPYQRPRGVRSVLRYGDNAIQNGNEIFPNLTWAVEEDPTVSTMSYEAEKRQREVSYGRITVDTNDKRRQHWMSRRGFYYFYAFLLLTAMSFVGASVAINSSCRRNPEKCASLNASSWPRRFLRPFSFPSRKVEGQDTKSASSSSSGSKCFPNPAELKRAFEIFKSDSLMDLPERWWIGWHHGWEPKRFCLQYTKRTSASSTSMPSAGVQGKQDLQSQRQQPVVAPPKISFKQQRQQRKLEASRTLHEQHPVDKKPQRIRGISRKDAEASSVDL